MFVNLAQHNSKEKGGQNKEIDVYGVRRKQVLSLENL